MNNFIMCVSAAVGIPNLDQAVAGALGPDIEYRVREILQEAIKFMKHAKRNHLTCADISHALQLHNVEQLFGYRGGNQPANTYIRAQGAGALYFPADEVVDFNKLLQAPLPPVPRDVSFTVHWLAIEGVQPAIPLNPSLKKKSAAQLRKKKATPLVKPVVAHVLSAELQRYFEEVSTAVLGSDAAALEAVLESVSADPGLNDLLPYLCQLVADEVAKHLRNLPVLQNLMKLTNSLLASQYLHVEPYLHQLVPSVLTCLVGKTLCEDPATENHWELRDDAADLVRQVVEAYGAAYTTLQPRIAKTLVGALLDWSKPLTSHYGAVRGLGAMGDGARVALLFPNLSMYVPHLQAARDDGPALRKSEAEHVFSALLEECAAYAQSALDEHAHWVETEQPEPVAGKGKRGRDETPVHPAISEASPWVKTFHDVFGASWEKHCKSLKLDLSLFK